MVFAWFKQRRRRKLTAHPFPTEWEQVLARNFADDTLLAPEERARLRRDVQVFAAEKNWEGCDGMEMTDEVRVTVGAQACLLTLGLDVSWFDHVLSVLVYPTEFMARTQHRLSGDMFIEGEADHLGQAWYRGPVRVAWPDALAGGRREAGGHNVVLHEFAHQLDFLNGRYVDGTPPIESSVQARRWEAVMAREYERLCRACDAGEDSLLDCYGAESRAEFFAVVTETFFSQPVRLQRRHAELYEVLAGFYLQDPAGRVLRPTP
jgi:Mlc titration factor MtfA (ptsG expression regulator)